MSKSLKRRFSKKGFYCSEEMLQSSRKTGENYVGEFFMKNGLLYRKHQETKTGRSSNQLVVPKGLRQQVMPVNHKSAFSGHLGAKKSEVRTLMNFLFPGLCQDVIRFCRCDVCQRTIKKGSQKD